jgi:hypothetical protein
MDCHIDAFFEESSFKFTNKDTVIPNLCNWNGLLLIPTSRDDDFLYFKAKTLQLFYDMTCLSPSELASTSSNPHHLTSKFSHVYSFPLVSDLSQKELPHKI